MNPGLSWRPASAASEFPFSFEVFDICIWCPKQQTHRPDLPVVGQHQFQSIESCARLTTLPTLMEDTRVRSRDNSGNKQGSLQGGPLIAWYSHYPNVDRLARRNPYARVVLKLI